MFFASAVRLDAVSLFLTVAMTVVDGRERRRLTSPRPMPRFAPLMTQVVFAVLMIAKLSSE